MFVSLCLFVSVPIKLGVHRFSCFSCQFVCAVACLIMLTGTHRMIQVLCFSSCCCQAGSLKTLSHLQLLSSGVGVSRHCLAVVVRLGVSRHSLISRQCFHCLCLGVRVEDHYGPQFSTAKKMNFPQQGLAFSAAFCCLENTLFFYTVFQKKFTVLLFAITKSDVDRFQ